MIILDIETTGTDPQKHQMVSLGAVDFETGETFYGECRIYKSDFVEQDALDWNGFTLEQITDPTKQTPLELYLKFVKWADGKSSMLAGQHVGSFDVQFLKEIHKRLRKSFDFPFRFQFVDLHSVFYAKYKKSYSMKNICELVGVAPEPIPHNALSGAKAEYECFKILLND
jgi:DNA polymerase III epsilon subunit-like protein